uniref:Proteolipid protein 1b n=1 Tax=Takifugu rubripes TaxID=31033 RepID=H2URK8_TAKRU
MGCYDSCIRCIGAVPYPSLVATLLCYTGMALFCGCGHEALSQTEVLVETYFARNASGLCGPGLLYRVLPVCDLRPGVLFLPLWNLSVGRGFLRLERRQAVLRGVQEHPVWPMPQPNIYHSDVHPGLYLAGSVALSAIPVFFLFNMEQTCHNINILAETTPSINQHGWICMDARQYGLLPWNAMPGKSCGMTLASICKTSEFYVTYDLYIAAFAGAGITLLALFVYMIATTYNYAVLRFLGRKGIR